VPSSNHPSKAAKLKDNLPVRLISTFFFAGYCPVAPGTFGSLIALAIIWFLVPDFFYILVPISLGLFFVSVWSAGRAEDIFGHDGSQIVIDEVTGMAISLVFIPHRLGYFVAAFFLFRIFDIIKPPPARRAERLKGGWGVTTDDVVAGVYANLVLHLVSYALSRI
jgi:phosphatidylglycerophosphatase A